MTTIIEQIYEVDAENDYKTEITVKLDGKVIFNVCDGEDEDNSICRNFSDCSKVLELLKQVYELGKNGVEVDFKDTEIGL